MPSPNGESKVRPSPVLSTQGAVPQGLTRIDHNTLPKLVAFSQGQSYDRIGTVTPNHSLGGTLKVRVYMAKEAGAKPSNIRSRLKKSLITEPPVEVKVITRTTSRLVASASTTR